MQNFSQSDGLVEEDNDPIEVEEISNSSVSLELHLNSSKISFQIGLWWKLLSVFLNKETIRTEALFSHQQTRQPLLDSVSVSVHVFHFLILCAIPDLYMHCL